MILSRHETHLEVAEVIVELRISSWTMSSFMYSIPVLRVSALPNSITIFPRTFLRVPVLASDWDEAHTLPRVLQAPHEQRRLSFTPVSIRGPITTRSRW